GYFYMTGSGVEPSDEAAITWLDRSVRQGYLHAFSFLAELHEKGRGTELSAEIAADLYWDALVKGDPTARERVTGQLDQREREVVRILQQKLKDVGAYRGLIDGLAGPSTVAAINRFTETLPEPS
ncbi:MAG: peptidoglycan-binding protein, partial [Pseudomonadota bacterium]